MGSFGVVTPFFKYAFLLVKTKKLLFYIGFGNKTLELRE